ALAEQHERHEVEDDQEDDDRLRDLHPPRLEVADLGEEAQVTSLGGIGSGADAGISDKPSAQGVSCCGTADGSHSRAPAWGSAVTSPAWRTLTGSSSVASARKTVPGGIAARSFTPASTLDPF